MAYQNPNKPIVGRYLATASSGPRIVIGPVGSSNVIQFFGKAGVNPPDDLVGTITVDQNINRMYFDAAGNRLMFDQGIGTELGGPSLRLSSNLVSGHDLTMNRNGYAGWTIDDPLLITDPNFGGPETWHDMTLNNTWVTFVAGREPQYRKGPDGTVTLRGLVKAGTAGSVITTLPVGYRPTRQVDIGLKSNNDATTYSWTQVRTNGDIINISAVAAAAVWLTLDMSFSTL